MNLIERVKNILITPKTEWDVINGETATPQSLLMGYVLPLSLVAAVGSLLKGFLFAGALSLKFFIITVYTLICLLLKTGNVVPAFASTRFTKKTWVSRELFNVVPKKWFAA